MLAITGTNGKTTVTTLVDAMLEASGVRSAAVGNTEVPLIAAIEDPSTEVFVVEASSFRLAQSRRFRPKVATWLNFAEDHLDVHDSLDAYPMPRPGSGPTRGPTTSRSPTARTRWCSRRSRRGPTGRATFASGWAPEPTVWSRTTGRSTVCWSDPTGSSCCAPTSSGARCPTIGPTPWRRLPPRSPAVPRWRGCAPRCATSPGCPTGCSWSEHTTGVRWFDDSKATAPHATLAAVAGFDSVVLIAGGRNKGLDLGALGAAGDRVRAVIGIGEAGPEAVAAFPSHTSVLADSMEAAVQAAVDLARAGDVVLLSPGCASFDWYGSYGERGEVFTRLVHELVLDGGPR